MLTVTKNTIYTPINMAMCILYMIASTIVTRGIGKRSGKNKPSKALPCHLAIKKAITIKARTRVNTIRGILLSTTRLL